jgi:hypothetical protein
MPEVPKIVRDRLRAGLPGGTVAAASHPDPDVLTAFAEQALSAAERDGVLEHLARCGDCRELVAFSIPPMEGGAQPVAAEESESAVPAVPHARRETGGRQSWFAWPGLRWAALAAGIAVAGGILLIHPGKQNVAPEAKQEPTSTVTRRDETIVAKKAAPLSDSVLKTTNPEKEPAPARRAFSRERESKLAYAGAAPATNAIARGQIEQGMASKDVAAGVVGGVVGGAAPASPAPAPRVPSASEVVEVTAASGPVTTEEARSDLAVTTRQVADLPLNGRNTTQLATISKAKAAKTESNEPSALQRSESLDKKQGTTETTAQPQRAAAAELSTTAANLRPDAGKADFAEHSAQWAIHGNDLQRFLSLASGLAWKTVLHSDHPLLCYAAGGNEVWAGGKGGDLFHSADGGVTWSQVHPSAQGQTLSDDVTHIDLNSPSQIVLSTSSNQSWSTADGGKIWVRK